MDPYAAAQRLGRELLAIAHDDDSVSMRRSIATIARMLGSPRPSAEDWDELQSHLERLHISVEPDLTARASGRVMLSATPSLTRGWVELSAGQLAAVAPVNAWLLIGDEASLPDLKDPGLLSAGLTWTGSKQAQQGDLLFIYFMAPDKHVRFAARAAADPYFSDEHEVNKKVPIDRRQWWIPLCEPVELAPIPAKTLWQVYGSVMNLRGRPSHYLKPAVAEQLIARGKPARPTRASDGTLKTPTGRPELPHPATATLAQLRDIADGGFRTEGEVEQYVVEPLMRLALTRHRNARLEGQVRVGRGLADFVVYRESRPTGVIEVKLGTHLRADSAQLHRYTSTLGVPGMLIDSGRIYLSSGTRLIREIRRRSLSSTDLRQIGDHLAASR